MPSDRAPERLFLLDGSALAYRSYFAFIRAPLVNSKGIDTSGAFGFTNTLLKILRDEKPEYIACLFDTSAPTFRHREYKEYKATREKMPDDLVDQLPAIRSIVEAFGIPLIEMEGFEADDLMATLTVRAEAAGIDTYLVTGDKDMMQLLSEHVKMYTLSKGGSGSEKEVVGPGEVQEKWGVRPDQITDLFGLMGDHSDNVPGVPGIGPKTAQELIGQFGSMETLYAGLDSVKRDSVREKLVTHRDLAMLSRKLITLRHDAPITVSIDDLRLREIDHGRIVPLFQELEFNKFLQELPSIGGESAQPAGRVCRIIQKEEDLDALISELAAVPMFVLDTETTSLQAMSAGLVGLSFSWKPGEAVYVPLLLPEGHFSGDLFSSSRGAQGGAVLRKMKKVLEDPRIRKSGQNIKYDMLVLRRHGIDIQGVDFDTMVAAYLINPSARAFGIDALALEYLNYQKIPTKSLIGSGAKQISMAEVELGKIAEYACEDAEIALRLRELFEPKLAEIGVESLFHDVEIPLIRVLAEMEENGVSLDLKLLARMSRDMDDDLERLKREIHGLAGEPFNINSTQQLGKILFDKLKVHEQAGWKRPRKTKTGYATDVSVLEALAGHPLPKKLLDYRQLQKLKSTYIDSLPLLINPATGRVHASFNQAVAATGRLSSSDPNLQNIPIRTELGREIRKAFVPAEKGSQILSADYNQIELRIMAHLSGDDTLMESFRQGEDVHRRTASEVFDIESGKVTDEHRRRAKTINFGILYGMGPFGLAQRLGISNEEAQSIITAYFARYPKVNEFIAATIAFAYKHGYVTTLLNRRRYLPEIRSDNRNIREFGERTAVNTPIQGTAADLIKLAMIRIAERLRKDSWKSKMILQIHDELVFEAPDSEVAGLSAMVKKEMEGAISLSVPVKVDVGVGGNWFEAH